METGKVKNRLRLVNSTFHPAVAGALPCRAPAAAPTDEYYRRIQMFGGRIRSTDDGDSMINVLDGARGDTRVLNDDAAVRVAPAKLAQAERRIEALTRELEQLRGLVHVDHLTGALNRSGLDVAYVREAALADRLDAPLGTALIDIDDFKRLNDQHGHQAGDAALVHLAQVIKRALRPSDIVVRFGGEEFLFLLPDSGSEQAASALSRLQHDLAQNPFIYSHRRLPLTFSAGIAVRKPGETRDAVIKRADQALYKAKNSGKNRAVTAD